MWVRLSPSLLTNHISNQEIMKQLTQNEKEIVELQLAKLLQSNAIPMMPFSVMKQNTYFQMAVSALVNMIECNS